MKASDFTLGMLLISTKDFYHQDIDSWSSTGRLIKAGNIFLFMKLEWDHGIFFSPTLGRKICVSPALFSDLRIVSS